MLSESVGEGAARKPMRAAYPLSVHLGAFAFVLLVPVLLLVGALLWRVATVERAELDQRVLQVAQDLAEDVDRELARHLAVLRALATSEALARGDLAKFREQAVTAVEGQRVVISLIDPTMQQLVNTNVPYGNALPQTGEPQAIAEAFAAKQPVVSNFFRSRLANEPRFGVASPIIVDGSVRSVLFAGINPQALLSMLEKRSLAPEWNTAISDRQGVVLARRHAHERFLVGRFRKICAIRSAYGKSPTLRVSGFCVRPRGRR